MLASYLSLAHSLDIYVEKCIMIMANCGLYKEMGNDTTIQTTDNNMMVEMSFTQRELGD